MMWEEAENRCNVLGGHLFSFKEEKDIKVIKHLHNAIHRHVNPEHYWTGLRFVNDLWSFTDDTNSYYATKTFVNVNEHSSPRSCVLLKNIRNPRPTPETRDCSSRHYFICQKSTNDSAYSMQSLTSKFMNHFLNLH